MKDRQSLAHICKQHIVIVSKYRKKAHAMADHIHMCLSVLPKYSIAMIIGYLKGKSAIRIHKKETGREAKGFTNKKFWTRGCCVSTVGLDEKKVREYIQNQEKLDRGK